MNEPKNHHSDTLEPQGNESRGQQEGTEPGIPKKPKKNLVVYNLIFAAVCAAIFLFLWNAPPETTAHVPTDEDHAAFLHMKKKEAEKHCGKCHSPDGIAPLPEDHPPKYRCLFCHKRDQDRM